MPTARPQTDYSPSVAGRLARPVALSVAGSDSGGGAGIQADARTFQRLGVFATTALTAVTAQNLSGVAGITGLSPEIVAQQIKAVTSGFAVKAAKTGMLWSADIVRAAARALTDQGVSQIVVDPVMMATSGSRLLAAEAVAAYADALIPRCTLLTPNLDEAAALLGCPPIQPEQLERRARDLVERFGCAVLLKGGHLPGPPRDVLCQRGEIVSWEHERVVDVNTHGTGCMLSAAITAFLARDLPLEQACSAGLAFVHDALTRAGGPDAPPHQLADLERAAAVASHLSRTSHAR